MRASLVFFVSALSAGVYSSETQQVLGSADPIGTLYQCQNGATPVTTCTDSSNVPSCSCTCSNGVTYNESLSVHTARNPNRFPDTCQAEKNNCLEREKTLAAQVTEAQEKQAECEATSLADRQKAELDALRQDQNCKLELSNKDLEISQCKQQSTNDLNAANSACKVQLSGKDIEITQCRQQSTNDLTAANNACNAKETQLNTKFAEYQKNNYRYVGCYEDNSSRVLAEHSKLDTGMTPQMCASICQNYTYFGVEVGLECYCGNTIKSGYSKVGGGACESKCQGDAGQICGGGWKISIYSRQA